MEETENSKKKWLNILQTVFWVAFIAVPLFTGILAYHWLPNESPMVGEQVQKPYKILASHEVCQDNGNCGTVPDAWQNTDTGQIFTQADFRSHRISERTRMTVTWFAYGLLGCFFFAGVTYYEKKDFYKYFGMAVTADLAVAAFTYISQRITY